MLKITCPLCSKELHTSEDGVEFDKHLQRNHGLDRTARLDMKYRLRKAYVLATLSK